MRETEDQRGQIIGLRQHSKPTKTEMSSNLPPRGELTEGILAPGISLQAMLHPTSVFHKVILVEELGWGALQKGNGLMMPYSSLLSLALVCGKDSALSGLCHFQ